MQLKRFKHTAFITCLIASASCGAQQPTAPVKDAPPAAQASTPAAKCPAIKELLTTLSQKKIFEQSPEVFFPTVASQLSIGKDETKPLGPNEKLRTLTLLGASPDWLISAEATYTAVKDSAAFNSLNIELNKSCFGTPKELISLAQNTLGKGGKKVTLPPPDSTEMIVWNWKDPDINMSRSLEINASATSYTIAVKREPSSEGAGG